MNVRLREKMMCSIRNWKSGYGKKKAIEVVKKSHKKNWYVYPSSKLML